MKAKFENTDNQNDIIILENPQAICVYLNNHWYAFLEWIK